VGGRHTPEATGVAPPRRAARRAAPTPRRAACAPAFC